MNKVKEAALITNIRQNYLEKLQYQDNQEKLNNFITDFNKEIDNITKEFDLQILKEIKKEAKKQLEIKKTEFNKELPIIFKYNQEIYLNDLTRVSSSFISNIRTNIKNNTLFVVNVSDTIKINIDILKVGDIPTILTILSNHLNQEYQSTIEKRLVKISDIDILLSSDRIQDVDIIDYQLKQLHKKYLTKNNEDKFYYLKECLSYFSFTEKETLINVNNKEENLVEYFHKMWFFTVFKTFYFDKNIHRYNLKQDIKGVSNLFLIYKGNQGSGKSTLINKITECLDNKIVEEEFDFSDKNNIENSMKMANNLIIKSHELKSFNSGDAKIFKQLSDRTYIEKRQLYTSNTQLSFKRIASFMGATNDLTPLYDMTGNRRFLVLTVEDFNKNILNKNQKCFELVWGEMYDYFIENNMVNNYTKEYTELVSILEKQNTSNTVKSNEQIYLEEIFDFERSKEINNLIKNKDFNKIKDKIVIFTAKDLDEYLTQNGHKRGNFSINYLENKLNDYKNTIKDIFHVDTKRLNSVSNDLTKLQGQYVENLMNNTKAVRTFFILVKNNDVEETKDFGIDISSLLNIKQNDN